MWSFQPSEIHSAFPAENICRWVCIPTGDWQSPQNWPIALRWREATSIRRQDSLFPSEGTHLTTIPRSRSTEVRRQKYLHLPWLVCGNIQEASRLWFHILHLLQTWGSPSLDQTPCEAVDYNEGLHKNFKHPSGCTALLQREILIHGVTVSVIYIIDNSTTISSPAAVLSLDAMKAFDRLESSRQGCPFSPPSLRTIAWTPGADSPPIGTYLSNLHQWQWPPLYADDILLYVDKAPQTIPHVLHIFNQFSEISGYKINWTKSALLPLNEAMSLVTLPPTIPIVKQLKYLSIDFFFFNRGHRKKNNLNKICGDLYWWTLMPSSLQARIAIIKIDILPWVNFICSMLPLPPPLKYLTYWMRQFLNLYGMENV